MSIRNDHIQVSYINRGALKSQECKTVETTFPSQDIFFPLKSG